MTQNSNYTGNNATSGNLSVVSSEVFNNQHIQPVASMKMGDTENPQGSSHNVQMESDKFGVSIHTRVMGSHSTRPGAVTVNESSVIREPTWDITKWVERPQVVESVTWSTALPPTFVLSSLNIPSDLLVTKFNSTPFNSFKYWRGDIELHIQTSGTPFHQGTVIMAYLPLVGAGPLVTQYTNNINTLTSIQHVILHANSSTSACMTIPFINPNLYVDTEASNFMDQSLGRVVIVVMNPLKAATGASTSINVNVVAQFKNSQFKIPRYQAEGLIEKYFGVSMGSVIQKMLPKNIIADSVDMALGLIGLDKPTSIERGPPMRMLGTSYMNSTADIEYIDKFTLFPSKLQETDASIFGVNDNEMLMSSLLSRFTYVGSFDQSTSNAPGTVLATVPLTPMIVPIVTTTSTAAPYQSYSNNLPLLQYVSLPYHYWKGGLSFKIQVVGTSFHNTKIFAAIQYGKYTASASPVSLPQATNQYGYAFEVNQGSTEFEFTVPYVSQYHQLLIPGSAGFLYNQATTMGVLTIYVLNELAVSNNVPSSISYNLFLAGASDFALNTLSSTNSAVVPNIDYVFSAESLFEDPMAVTIQTDKNVISPSNIVAERSDVSDQSVNSLIDYLKKYNLIFSGKAPLSNTVPNYRLFYINQLFRPPSLSSGDIINTAFFNAFSTTSALYRGYRGPLRFKIVLRTAGDVTQSARVFYIPPRPVSSLTVEQAVVSALVDDPIAIVNRNRPWLHTNVANSVAKTMEIEIPYANYTNFIVPGYNESDLGSLLIQFDAANSGADDVQYDIFAALGDESKFGVFRGVPSVSIGLNPTTGFPLDPSLAWTASGSALFSLYQLK